MEQNVPESRIRIRYDHFAALRAAATTGLGCVSLPCFSCDDDPALERIPGTYEATDLQFWVLTHPDLRKSARVRAFLQFFGTRLAAMEHRLMGMRATPVAAAAQA